MTSGQAAIRSAAQAAAADFALLVPRLEALTVPEELTSTQALQHQAVTTSLDIVRSLGSGTSTSGGFATGATEANQLWGEAYAELSASCP